ncbi:hypothetical protein SLS63_008065 [Diaporthe eres]|uniref:Uncharacterized protein n=1 Tax=Diaporthe eres TaxID=83184 RepID=A0ABR1P3S6_DIAER
MGIASAKIGDPRQSTQHGSDTTPPKITKPPVSQQEITYWERIYKERFSRAFILSTYTLEPLSDGLWRPTTNRRWQHRLDTDTCWNRCNPRYIGPTPEPLTKELAARTRHELRAHYRRCLVEVGLRHRLREWWEDRGCQVVRVPYLSGDVDFPPASEITNGYILPARVRADILGQSDEVPVEKDPFLEMELFYVTCRLRLDDHSQVPYEDDLPKEGPWLNQTTAVYFEPGVGKRGIGIMGRSIFSAWREVDEARGETPNLQQRRYFANAVMLMGEPKRRPITDIVATHKRICDAVADAQDKPVSPKDTYSWVEHGAEMGVVYRSVIIVVDKEYYPRQGANEAETRGIMFGQTSVLLVRTGNEDHLSEPVDLTELGQAILPLGRDEVLHEKQQVVRVRLRTAVRFIMDLERRERDRSPRLTEMKKLLDDETFRETDNFASEALAVAETNGSIDRQ